MTDVISTELARECAAVQIPYGSTTNLPKGTQVDIIQTLGGTFTVRTPEGMFRIAGKDADALGVQPPADAPAKPPGGEGAGPVDEKLVWDTLRTCYDPEIPVNIVDLGLVYDMVLEKAASGASKISVKMTLTAPGCGMGATIAGDAQQKLLMLDGVEEASVEIVWDPPWHQSMITEQGRRILGL
ncbi:MAG TPA: putative Fe-S cluster assembly protein SufT [Verrucomicrobiales bacterium]|nr:putative Fe-S cluster assembly protein SufT [Verrucomicrobiales bacterium]